MGYVAGVSELDTQRDDVGDADGTPANVKHVIACCHDLNNRLSSVAGVSELGTQRDDVKIGSADGEAWDGVRPL